MYKVEEQIRGIMVYIWHAFDVKGNKNGGKLMRKCMLALFFVKYVSEFYKQYWLDLQERYGANDPRLEIYKKLGRFVVPEGCLFGELYERRNESNIGEILNEAFKKLAKANSAKMMEKGDVSLFYGVDCNNEELGKREEKNEFLKNLLHELEQLDFDHSSVRMYFSSADWMFNILLSRIIEDDNKGNFYTPLPIANLMVSLTSPEIKERIYDPVCGTGGLLLAAASKIQGVNFSLFGQENNREVWALAKMNMLVHELDDAIISLGDALESPLVVENKLEKFEVVLAHLPFGQTYWNVNAGREDIYRRFNFGIPASNKTDGAFLSHILSVLSREGRAAVIVQQGVLFREGVDANIRKSMVEQGILEAVIGLPVNVLYDTNVAGVILILRKNRKNSEVLFVDIPGHKEGRKRNELQQCDLDRLIGIYKEFSGYGRSMGEGVVEKNSSSIYTKVVAKDQILENGCNLLSYLYPEKKQTADKNLFEMLNEVRRIEAELTVIRGEIERKIRCSEYKDLI